MRTRTAPSDRSRMAAISAVDISCTKRRIDGPPPITGQPIDRGPGRRRRLAVDHGRLDVERVGCRDRVIERSLGSATHPAASLGDDVAGDPEEPDPERRGVTPVLDARALLEPGQRRKRGQERPLGGVLRLVVIAELVDREAVHLCHVLPIERVETRGIRARSLHERPIEVEGGEPSATGLLRAASPSSMPVGPSRYTPPGVATRTASRTWAISPTKTGRPSTRSAPVSMSTPVAVTVDFAPSAPTRSTARSGRDLALAPARTVELPVAKVVDARPRAGRGRTSSNAAWSTGPDASSAQRRHRVREIGREVATRPVAVHADPDHRARIVGPDPVALAEHAGQLPQPARSLDDEVVRPLQRDRPRRQPAISSPASAIASDVIAASRHS